MMSYHAFRPLLSILHLFALEDWQALGKVCDYMQRYPELVGGGEEMLYRISKAAKLAEDT